MLCEIKLLSHLSQCIKSASVKRVCSRLEAPNAQAHTSVDEETRLQHVQNAYAHVQYTVHIPTLL